MHLEFLDALRRDRRSGAARVRLYSKMSSRCGCSLSMKLSTFRRRMSGEKRLCCRCSHCTSTGGWLAPEAALELTACRPASRSASPASEPHDSQRIASRTNITTNRSVSLRTSLENITAAFFKGYKRLSSLADRRFSSPWSKNDYWIRHYALDTCSTFRVFRG